MLVDRKTGHEIVQARRLLLAKVVVSLRLEGEARYKELERLQAEFERVIREELPLALRLEKVLAKHVLEPAERILARRGVLWVAQQMRGWDL